MVCGRRSLNVLLPGNGPGDDRKFPYYEVAVCFDTRHGGNEYKPTMTVHCPIQQSFEQL